jgi:hypothetical protein
MTAASTDSQRQAKHTFPNHDDDVAPKQHDEPATGHSGFHTLMVLLPSAAAALLIVIIPNTCPSLHLCRCGPHHGLLVLHTW